MDSIKASIKRHKTERIDSLSPIRPMSYNCPGHEDRMKAHCERVEAEKNKYRVLIKLFKVLHKRVEEKINRLKVMRHTKVVMLLELKLSYRSVLKDLREAWSGF